MALTIESMLEIINGTVLSNLCDYSFGDHLGGLDPTSLQGGFMKEANDSNAEFIAKCKEFEERIMTLFVDNIRLYNRPLLVNAGADADWVTYLLQNNDLLAVCAKLIHNKFIIFTSHEDTPIDDKIVVPENVLGIHACNAVFNNEKVHPFPIGLQRQFGTNDHRIDIIKAEIDKKIEPTKLVYINCGLGFERNNKERAYLPHFQQYSWATCRFEANSKYFPHERYKDFLDELRDHKFVICSEGHGMDCHRNWETLYMRRVPIMKKSPYFGILMQGFPVLYVDDWNQINEELLQESDYLYQEAQEMSLKKLDLNLIFKAIVQSYGGN